VLPGGSDSGHVKPGESYPAGYVGSKYSLRRVQGKVSLSLKSYSGNYVESDELPKNLLSTIRDLKGKYSGSLRIRWNGDTILAPQNGEPPIYIGKMRYENGAGSAFPGLDLDCPKTGTLSVYAGPQSPLDVGEIWSVPAIGHIRPNLTRRRRSRSEGERRRVNTATKHPELIDYVIHNIQWEGKRMYITNFGHIVSPVSVHLLRNKGVDLEETVNDFVEQDLFNAARFTFDRAERTYNRFGRPWVMATIGHVNDYDETGPQPDLSTGPEYYLSDENVKEE
jgi:hypothetical protein